MCCASSGNIFSWLLVAAVGAVVILAGIIVQIAQLAVSIRQREALRDTTGDPWNGRSLEWSIPSPAPSYNFAAQPIVHTRDEFWERKNGTEHQEQHFEDFSMPKNSGLGLIIAAFVYFLGFGAVWHMWWLVVIGLVGAIVTLIVRTFDEDTEYTVRASDLAHAEAGLSSALNI